ncbi:MAG: death-on-curing protein [Candidatus Magasanikbacteria bacterium CG11_big_fil_rev_8_21_14_0_20_43_7]|uniref:Death-on-curing protein n=1 Tax=Candidatus Magasanikbacteria bacterium CG11_big_fil_rev_8_21_14_0_20_43_7 TaxID=1974654 RepID=A0A2H0N5V1_9BACT|nr:MAG: death-on-curing protein [Candidatus Magasanikbacteria bacterium CG11_big_fil_rev_8_21_14_0_20_43_7]
MNKKKTNLSPGREKQDMILYQAKSGKIEFRGDSEHETIWASQKQIAELFDVRIPTINEHLKKIFSSQELDKNSVIRKFLITASDGKQYMTNFYNLDAIISVGYRVNSKHATQFRIWATKTIKAHLVDGYTINKQRIGQNYDQFLRAINDIQALLPKGKKIDPRDVVELIRAFAGTWMSLDAYDTANFPKGKITKKKITVTADELAEAIVALKKELMKKEQASELFAQERNRNSLEGIVGNVFQSFGGTDMYPSLEEKASHILYFMIKNHPFVDGNKRSGAFAFIWFLRKAGILRASLTPEALTALTLFVAESNSKEKDKMIGVVMLLLQK